MCWFILLHLCNWMIWKRIYLYARNSYHPMPQQIVERCWGSFHSGCSARGYYGMLLRSVQAPTRLRRPDYRLCYLISYEGGQDSIAPATTYPNINKGCHSDHPKTSIKCCCGLSLVLFVTIGYNLLSSVKSDSHKTGEHICLKALLPGLRIATDSNSPLKTRT